MVTQSNRYQGETSRTRTTINTTKRVQEERISLAGETRDEKKKKQATKEESSKEQRQSKNNEFSLRSGDIKEINYYMGKEDLDCSCDDDDYGISPFVFPSSKMKQRELEYNIQKDTQVLKLEAKKRAMKRDLHNKKKTIHQFKTE